MPETLRCTPSETIVTGWDFSTGSVKCLAFDLTGKTVAEFRGTTDLWERDGAVELNAMMLEGQARASVRGIVSQLRDLGRLNDWHCGGISATHHTCGRIDADCNPVRRLICWNDQTLANYHAKGLERLGGQDHVKKLIGGPWAVRYSLSHLVKDEETLCDADWNRTHRILPHGPMAAGYLTGNFDVISVSSAASTGILDMRHDQWQRGMLGALTSNVRRVQVANALPRVIGMNEPIGPLSASVCAENELAHSPIVFPTLDDQAAGLIGGGATDAGHVAIILGNSAVVNSSAGTAPQSGTLDAMKLNWGPYLWMRCYSNGAQFIDRVVGPKPDWVKLEAAAKAVPPGCLGTTVLPFARSEPSIGVTAARVEWSPHEPTDPGMRLRAAYEAIAYLIALAIEEHEAAGQSITRLTVSGGISRSDLMVEILASTVNRRMERLVSSEGTALGAAMAALAGYETHLRLKQGIHEPFTATDAVATMVRFQSAIEPNPAWKPIYQQGLAQFRKRLS